MHYSNILLDKARYKIIIYVMDEINRFICNVGFPIAVATGLFYIVNRTLKDLTTAVNNLNFKLDDLLSHLKSK